MPSITLSANSDAVMLRYSYLSDIIYYWDGGEAHTCCGTIRLGPDDGGDYYYYVFRSVVKFPIDSSGWTGITSATLRFRNDGGAVHGNQSGNHYAIVSRMTQDWSETGGSGETYTHNGPYSWANRNSSYTTSNQVTSSVWNGALNGNKDIDVTAIVRDWFNGQPNYGFMVRNSAESSDYFEFKTRNYGGGSLVPQLIINYTTNVAPDAPTGLSPNHTMTYSVNPPVFHGTFTDADAGDTISKAQVQVFSDAGGTNLVWDSGQVDGRPTYSDFSIQGPSLTFGTSYWKARVADSHSAWGVWSSLESFFIDNPPPTPTGCSPTSNITVGSVIPVFSGTSQDPDAGDHLATVRIVVTRLSDSVVVWDNTSTASGSTFSVTYAGPTLNWATTYKWNGYVTDNYGASSGSTADNLFTTPASGLVTPTAPNNTKLNSLATNFTGTTPSTMNAVQVILYDGTGTSQIYDSGTVAASGTSFSTAYTLPALASKYMWKARFRDSATSVWSVYTSLIPFWTNYSPSASITSPISGGFVSGIVPTFTSVYGDPDLSNGFSDTPTSYEIEVSRVSDGVVMYTLSRTTSLTSSVNSMKAGDAGVTQTAGAGGNTLTLETWYRCRVRYADNSGAANATGSWTSYITFKPTTWPSLSRTISTISVANPTVVTTSAAHGLTSTDVVEVFGSNSTPTITGRRVATVSSGSAFTVPINVTVGGNTGSVSRFVVQAASLDVSGNISGPMPVLSWLAYFGGSKTQTAVSIKVLDANNNDSIVYSVDNISTALTTYTIPAGVLLNGGCYKFNLFVTDSDGLISPSVTTTSYNTLWTPPSPLANMSVVATDFGYIQISWDASLLGVDFDHYTVYRRVAGSTSWTTLGYISSVSSLEYTDYVAGLNITYEYMVTQWKKVASSTPIESTNNIVTSTSLSVDDWFIVVVGRDDLCFSFSSDQEEHKSPFASETFEPFGRDRKVIVRAGVLGREGSVSTIIPAEDVSSTMTSLRAIFYLNNVDVFLKNPFGDVNSVYIDAPDEQYINGGHLILKIPYVEVD